MPTQPLHAYRPDPPCLTPRPLFALRIVRIQPSPRIHASNSRATLCLAVPALLHAQRIHTQRPPAQALPSCPHPRSAAAHAPQPRKDHSHNNGHPPSTIRFRLYSHPARPHTSPAVRAPVARLARISSTASGACVPRSRTIARRTSATRTLRDIGRSTPCAPAPCRGRASACTAHKMRHIRDPPIPPLADTSPSVRASHHSHYWFAHIASASLLHLSSLPQLILVPNILAHKCLNDFPHAW